MTIPALSLNFLPGFSHSVLPLRAVFWMTSLKAHRCFHLPAREMAAYSFPLGNQVYLPRKSLFLVLCSGVFSKLSVCLLALPLCHLWEEKYTFMLIYARKRVTFRLIFWVTFSVGQGDSLSSSVKGCFKVAPRSFSIGLLFPLQFQFESLDFWMLI